MQVLQQTVAVTQPAQIPPTALAMAASAATQNHSSHHHHQGATSVGVVSQTHAQTNATQAQLLASRIQNLTGATHQQLHNAIQTSQVTF